MASLASLLYDLRRIEAHREVLTEKKIQKIYGSLKKDLTAMIANEYVDHADPNGALFYGSIEEKVREARFLEEISTRVSDITPELKAEIDDLCEKVYTDCYKGLHKAVTATTDGAEAAAALSTIKANPRIIKRMYENGITKLTLPPLLERQRADIIYQIKQELTIGMINGDRQDVVARKISERLDFTMKKANNIVRTETHRNIETGMYDSAVSINEGLQGSDLVLVKIWRTMKDERVRPQQRRKTKKGWKTTRSKNGADHMKMEGVAVLADEDFKLEPDVKAKCPSQSGVARHDCNCRCFVEYKVMKRAEYEKMAAQTTSKAVANASNNGIMSSSNRPQDAQQAQQMLVNDVGFAFVEPSVSAIDDQLLIENTVQLANLEKKFGIVHKSSGSFSAENGGSGTVAYVRSYVTQPTSQNMSLCKSHYKSWQTHIASETQSVSSGWSMPCALTESELAVYSATHEYGHMLQNYLVQQAFEADGWTAADPHAFVNRNRKTAKAQLKWYYDRRKKVQDECFAEIVAIARQNNPNFSLSTELSQYGRTNKAEFFAEVFANSQLSKPNELGKAMLIWLKRKGLL